MPLNDKQVLNAKPKEGAYKLFDGGGLYVLIEPTGRKYWRFKYTYLRSEKLLSVGVYPMVSLKVARKSAQKLRDTLEAGKDPGAERKRAKVTKAINAANTFELVARDWHASRLGIWDKGHASKVMTSLERNVFPVLGPLPIVDVTPPEILAVVREIEKRGALDIAGRVLQRIRSVFRFAVGEGKIASDPSRDLIGALKVRKTVHHAYLRESELPEFLEKLEAYSGAPLTKIAVKLIMRTFVRTTELREARWAEIDLEAAEWRIPEERMKMKDEHIVPLSRQCVELFREAKEISGNRAFIFPNRNKPNRCMSENTMLYALYRMGYHDRATIHGFRSTASTVLNERAYDDDVIERQLAHAERKKSRRAYNHAQYLAERRALMQDWSDLLDQFALRKA